MGNRGFVLSYCDATRVLVVTVEKYFVTEGNQKAIIMLENVSVKEMAETVRF